MGTAPAVGGAGGGGSVVLDPPIESLPFRFMSDIMGSTSKVIARETFCYITAESAMHHAWLQVRLRFENSMI